MLLDTSTAPLISAAALTAAYAAYRANEVLFSKPRDRASGGSTSPSRHDHDFHTSLTSQMIDDNSTILEGSTALLFPVIATVSIIVLFFFLKSIGIIFTILSAISSFFALCFTLYPLVLTLCQLLFHRKIFAPHYVRSLQQSAAYAVTLTLSAATIGTWLFTGHWLVNNAIGISLCILFASICKVPSLKVAAILCVGLFLYDIFFVFFSERLFGRNVMVEVATTQPDNPASAIADWLSLPISPVKHLALPAKLVLPTSQGSEAILGLGDIILPEILLTYLLEFDLRHIASSTDVTLSFTLVRQLAAGLFLPALFAYVLALLVSFYCNFAFAAAQPALLYIVPLVLGTAAGIAASRRQLAALWTGNMPTSLPHELPVDNEHMDMDQITVVDERNAVTTSARVSESYTLLGSNKP